tara:strand:- start:113 stop:484 length:372 start_codon:yes stop_codon:yes gene_type:complete
MQIYSVNGDFYENYDLAVLNAIGTKYMVKSHELVEGYEIDIETSDNKRLLTFIDETGKEYSIDFKVSFSKENDAPFGGEYIDYEIEGIWVEGESLSSLNISKKFKDEILSEIESVVEREINKM